MLLAAVLAPFVVATVMPLLAGRLGPRIGYVAATANAALFVYFAGLLRLDRSASAPKFGWDWVPAFGVRIDLAVDGFSLLFALIITGLGALVAAYAVAYLGRREDHGKFYLYLLLFIGAMLGVALSSDLISLYVFWELTSASSFLLIGFWHTRKESSAGALKALLITVAGGLAMLAGFVLLAIAAGGTAGPVVFGLGDLAAARSAIFASPLAPWALVLILAGAFTKSAQAPFHIWLPDAMAAPTPVSAYLHSAAMVKAGLILVAKVWPLFAAYPLWTPLVAGAGLTTMLLGGFLALTKTDLKGLLALSTVSQLGMIMAALGLGTRAGLAAAITHIISHATFKGALFMAVGIIDHETGTRDIRRLGGLASRMPITATITIIGSLAMMGIPVLNGFVSKEAVFSAMEGLTGRGSWLDWLPAVVVVTASIFTAAYCLVLAHRLWFGTPARTANGAADNHHANGHTNDHTNDHDPSRAHDPQPGLWLPPAILIAWVVITGFFPGLLNGVVGAATASLAGGSAAAHLVVWHGLDPALLMSMVAIGGGLALYFSPLLPRVAAGLKLRFHANAAYDATLVALDAGPKALTRWHMTGLLRDYLVYTLLATVLAGLLMLPGRSLILMPGGAGVEPYEAAILFSMAAGALMTVLARNRLVALVALGLVGAGVTLFWALVRAPDLALTQLVIEAVSMVLFLLAFAGLPQLLPETSSRRERAWNGLVAVATGLLATGITYVAARSEPLAAVTAPVVNLKEYFLGKSYVAAGGHNVVNVIIVDFRGLDTLGETTVVGIAVLAVVALIRLRRRRRVPAAALASAPGTHPPADPPDSGPTAGKEDRS